MDIKLLRKFRFIEVFFHMVMLGMAFSPLIGHRFLPSVDLPDHLATIRIFSEHLRGEYSEELKLNFSPAYKPFLIVAAVIYECLPRTMVSAFPALTVAACISFFYLSMWLALRTLASGANRQVFVRIAMTGSLTFLFYQTAFYWGIMSFVFAIPIAVLAYALYLRWLSGEETKFLKFFSIVSAISHISHPISTIYLGMFVFSASFVTLLLNRFRNLKSLLILLSFWSIGIVLLHKMTFRGQAHLDLEHLIEVSSAPFKGLSKMVDFARFIIFRPQWEVFGSSPIPHWSYIPVFLGIVGLFVIILAFFRVARRAHDTSSELKTRVPTSWFYMMTILTGVLLFFCLRDDLFSISGPGSSWYDVRGGMFAVTSLLVVFCGVVLSQLAVLNNRYLNVVCTGLLVLNAAICSLKLRTDFQRFDAAVRLVYQHPPTTETPSPDPVLFAQEHLMAYQCLYEAEPRCPTMRDLWFVKLPELEIFLISPTGRGTLP